MSNQKKVIVTIIAGMAGLFFICTNFCMPTAKDNTKLRQQHKQLKIQAEIIGKLSEDELETLQSELKAAVSKLEEKIPSQGKLSLVEQITRVPDGANMVFSEITHKQSIEKEGYEIFPVDINATASFYDIIKYLLDVESSSLVIAVESLNLKRLRPKDDSLNLSVTFFGFRLTHKFSTLNKYLEDKYKPLDMRRLEKILKPVERIDSSREVTSRLKDYNPFILSSALRAKDKIDTGKGQYEIIDTSNFFLQGVMRLGKEKVAMINDNIVKEGETIGGMEIVEIEDYSVILMKSKRKYILKMGVEDELIKP